jgi:hypothetical protein
MANPTALAVRPAQPVATPQQPTIMRAPFVFGAREKVEPAFPDVNATMTTAAQQLGPYPVAAGGFLRHILLLVTVTTAGNAATVAFKEDAPWSMFDEVTLLDVNGNPIFGPVSGFDCYLSNLIGGYSNQGDPSQSSLYSVTTGAGATGGSFTFLMRIPVEIVMREGLGSLPNENSAAAYQVRLTLAASTNVYSTAPTTLGSVNVKAYVESWTVPPPVTVTGRPQDDQPLGLGTLSMWSKTVVNLSAGSQTVRFPRMGNWLRNLIFIFRDTTPVRSATVPGSSLRLMWDQYELLNLDPRVLRHYMSERYRFTSAQLPTGVYAMDMTREMDGQPGQELHALWLPTTQATRMELQLVAGAAGTVSILTNDVIPVGDGVVM